MAGGTPFPELGRILARAYKHAPHFPNRLVCFRKTRRAAIEDYSRLHNAPGPGLPSRRTGNHAPIARRFGVAGADFTAIRLKAEESIRKRACRRVRKLVRPFRS